MEELGEGAFGKALKCRRRRDNQIFVVKIMHESKMSAKAIEEVSHPALIGHMAVPGLCMGPSLRSPSLHAGILPSVINGVHMGIPSCNIRPVQQHRGLPPLVCLAIHLLRFCCLSTDCVDLSGPMPRTCG